MALPVFYGEEEEDAYWWILCIEKIFKEQGTRETLKVVKAITSFRGLALRWWMWRSQYKAPTTWDTFTTVFLFHFKPEWREILPIEDEEEQPYLDSTKSVDETSFHDEFVVEQIPTTDGDLKESSSSDLYDEVEPDLKSMTTIKKTSCLENFVVEPVSSIDERVVIPMLKPCSKITDSVCVVKSHSTPMGFSDEVEFSVTPIPPKPPDSPSLRVSNVTTLLYSKPFDLIPKEKRLLPISDPNIRSTPFPLEFASSKDTHDFPKSFLHKPSLRELESQQSMESASFQKKFGLSSLFQICRPTHNLALGDGFYLVATALHDTIIHPLHIFQTPTTLDTSVKLVVETQFKDAGFHVDVDFLVPPKSPDFNLDYANSVMPPPAPTTVYSRYESQQFSLNILSRIPSQFILNSKNSFNFQVMITLGEYFVMVDQIVAEFLCCGTSEYRKYTETGFSDIGHHMFVEIPLSIIQLLSSIPFPPKPPDPCFWLNNSTMLPSPSFKMWEYLIYKAKEEGSKSTGSKISRLFWHGGSVYDAWFSCASKEVAQVLLTLCYYNMMLKLYAQKGKFEKLDRSIPNSAILHELETRKIFLFGLYQGAGIFDGADQRNRQSLALGKQVEYYSNVYEELTPEVGATALQKQLSKLIFVMMIGSNDLFGYFESSEPLDFLTPQDYVDSMIFSQKLQLQGIYANGGRKFEIAGVGVIGCCHAFRLKNKTECVVETNY